MVVVAESRFQIRTMWLLNLSSCLIPSNPVSWFKRLDTISDSSVLKGDQHPSLSFDCFTLKIGLPDLVNKNTKHLIKFKTQIKQ